MDIINNHPKLLYPSMVIAAITVTIFSLLGIATLTGALPFAHSHTGGYAQQRYGAEEGEDGYQAEPKDRKNIVSKRSAFLSCPTCGVVESIRAVEVKDDGTVSGIAAGGLAGAPADKTARHGDGRTGAAILGAGGTDVGNEAAKNMGMHTSYRIRVRLNDDTTRTLYQRNAPGVSAGDRVKIVDGALVQQS